MSLRNIGIVYRKELTDSLRDRRTLVSMIVIPLLLFPVMMLGFSYLAVKLVGQAKKEVPQIMVDRKSTRLNSSHGYISYAVFCLKKKKKTKITVLAHKPSEQASVCTA